VNGLGVILSVIVDIVNNLQIKYEESNDEVVGIILDKLNSNITKNK